MYIVTLLLTVYLGIIYSHCHSKHLTFMLLMFSCLPLFEVRVLLYPERMSAHKFSQCDLSQPRVRIKYSWYLESVKSTQWNIYSITVIKMSICTICICINALILCQNTELTNLILNDTSKDYLLINATVTGVCKEAGVRVQTELAIPGES